ncbi:hypothetical protein QBC46DRAFT_377198 [Diplogelasinospora grovesii]|uniref:Secreted protein n=1 Tax=Diplogelasinospora grovesii TaxID=303347 RepID=A0AAN6NCX8_9PEZI|nr:hypothetical protein QBC46DRAFT_377198 [Diplogelasinospora grovesii]
MVDRVGWLVCCRLQFLTVSLAFFLEPSVERTCFTSAKKKKDNADMTAHPLQFRHSEVKKSQTRNENDPRMGKGTKISATVLSVSYRSPNRSTSRTSV